MIKKTKWHFAVWFSGHDELQSQVGLDDLGCLSNLNDSMIHMASQVFPCVRQMLNKALRRPHVVHGSGLCLKKLRDQKLFPVHLELTKLFQCTFMSHVGSQPGLFLRWSRVFGAPIFFSSSSLCLRHVFLPSPPSLEKSCSEIHSPR